MGSTVFNLDYHLVFATKYREPWITESIQPHLYAYIAACAKQIGAYVMEIGGIEDHIHILLAARPKHNISDLLREIKAPSSHWMHTECGLQQFAWQDGYAAFSVSHADRDRVAAYIRGQRQHHHRGEHFEDEYRRLLREEGAVFDERYLFD